MLTTGRRRWLYITSYEGEKKMEIPQIKKIRTPVAGMRILGPPSFFSRSPMFMIATVDYTLFKS